MTARGPDDVLAPLSMRGIGYSLLTECENDEFCLEFGGIEKSEEMNVCDLVAMNVSRAEEERLTDLYDDRGGCIHDGPCCRFGE